MENMVDYAEHMLLPVEELPYNAVDSLILSQFSHFRFSGKNPDLFTWRGVPMEDLFREEISDDLFFDIWDPKNSRRLFEAMAKNPRYAHAVVKGFVENTDAKVDKQFAAVCVQFNDDLCAVIFRGTDSSLVGWKEDLNMAFQSPIPSQTDALSYLARVAEHCPGSLCVGGHSKGGNLAVYASVFSDECVKARIARIYSHDGPGFLKNVLDSEQFRTVADRIDKTVPQSSIVGMLLESQEKFRVVRSNRFGIMQHDPFSWEVRNTDFVSIASLSATAGYLDKTLNRWLESIPDPDRRRLVNLIFRLVDSEEVATTTELWARWKKNTSALIKKITRVDEETKKFLNKTVKGLFSLGIKNFPELWREPVKQAKKKTTGKRLPPSTATEKPKEMTGPTH